MKRVVFVVLASLCFCLTTNYAFAQAPQTFPYQAVARDNDGNVLAGLTVNVRFSVHDGSNAGPIVYQESQSTTTNMLGLFTLNIGQGSVISGTFSGINWGSGSKFIEVEIDPNGGTNFLPLGSTQLLSVPYALFANVPGVPGPQGPAGTVANGTAANQVILSNASSPFAPTYVTVTGDGTLLSNGTLTIATDAINSSKILDNTITNNDISAGAAIDRSKMASGNPGQVVVNDGSGNLSSVATVPVSNGGTGANTLTGYIKGNGTSPMTAGNTIPGSDISGNISGNAGNVTGTVAVPNGGTGTTTLTGYIKGNGTSPMTAGNTIPGSDISGNISGNAGNVTGTVAVPNGGTGTNTLTGYIKGNGTSPMTAGNTIPGSDISGNISGNAGNVTGIVAVTNGGTGTNSLTNNGVLIGKGTNDITATSVGASNTVLHGNTGAAPTFSAVSLGADVSGTLPVSNGGTGTSTAFTPGSVLFAGAGGTYAQDNANLFFDATSNRLGIGTSTPLRKLDVEIGGAAADGIRVGIPGQSIVYLGDNSTTAENGILKLYNNSGDSSVSIYSNGDSWLDGGNVGIGLRNPTAKLEITPSSAKAILINPYGVNATNTGEIQFKELAANGSATVGLKAPDAISTSQIWTLPATDGTASQTLKTDGAGHLGWASTATNALNPGDIFVGNASGIATDVVLSGDATMSSTGALTIGAGKINSSKILDNTITASDIATGAVTSTIILDNTITANDIATSAVTSTEISDATIVNADISATADIARTKIAGGSANQVVVNNASGDLSSVAVLPVSNGGSGTSTAFTLGSVLYAGTGGAYSQDNANLFFDHINNRLGIGTNAPAEQLQLNDYNSAGPTNLKLCTKGVNGSPTGPKTSSIFFRHFSDDYGFSFTSTDDNAGGQFEIKSHLNDATGITRFLIERNSGNIGIGTSSPANRLHIKSAAQGTAPLALMHSGSNSNFFAVYETTTDNAALQSMFDGSGAERIRFDADGQSWFNGGNVGIGMTYSNYLLDIQASGTGTTPFVIDHHNSGDHLFAFNETTQNAGLQQIFKSSGSTEAIRFDANGESWFNGGNVGIGNTNPSNKLSVTGNADFDGRVGIGTNSPDYKLHVETGTGQAYIRGSGSTSHLSSNEQFYTDSYPLFLDASGQGMAIRLHSGAPNGDNNFISFMSYGTSTSNTFVRGRIESFDLAHDYAPPDPVTDLGGYICYVNNLVGPIPVDPLTYATVVANIAVTLACSDGGVTYGSGYGDYAEYLEMENKNEKMTFADIVGVKGGKVCKNTEQAEQFMVISRAPIVLGNMPMDSDLNKYQKIAFMGQVPVKVRGKVKSGDFIIPSGLHDGFGIAVSPEHITLAQVSSIVGRSWMTLENDLPKLVNVVVGVKGNEFAEIMKREKENMLEQTKSLQMKLDAQQQQIDELKILVLNSLPTPQPKSSRTVLTELNPVSSGSSNLPGHEK